MNAFNDIKRKVERIAGVEFKVKDFYSSGASRFSQMDLKLVAYVSAQLKHKNIPTTQKYFTRIKKGKAADRL